MPQPLSTSSQVFNNADSFAQCFDEAWQAHGIREPREPLTPDEKLEAILRQLADHPFAQGDPATARQVGAFRIRLLGLELSR